MVMKSIKKPHLYPVFFTIFIYGTETKILPHINSPMTLQDDCLFASFFSIFLSGFDDIKQKYLTLQKNS